MNRTISGLITVSLLLIFAGIAGCGGTSSPSTTQTSQGHSNQPVSTSVTSGGTTGSAAASSSVKGNADIWNDIPIYPNSQQAQDGGLGQSVADDPSYSLIEWRFFSSTDDIAKVSTFFKEQMSAKGWIKDMWADSGEMAYGSFHKNNDTRMSFVYVIKGEGGTSMNIMSAAK
jgi:hypothetical protein